MSPAELSFYLFSVFNGLRLFSYLPQIYKVSQDVNGASAISYVTWGLWTAANASTAFYAWANLGEHAMAAINTANALCCMIVICVTVVKRRRYRACRLTPNARMQALPAATRKQSPKSAASGSEPGPEVGISGDGTPETLRSQHADRRPLQLVPGRRRIGRATPSRSLLH